MGSSMTPEHQQAERELKPCAFCGSNDVSLARCGFGTGRVTCLECGAEGPYRQTHSEAIAAWNRRAGERDDVVPPAGCEHCGGTGQVFTHAEDCADDLCALNGDEHSCSGRVEPCTCIAPPSPMIAASQDSAKGGKP